MNVVNVGYDSTNYYIIEARGGKLLVDCGWPGTLPKFMAGLKRKGVAFKEIKYLLVTHFHPDHAGLVQELKNQGIKLILPECQTDFIAPFAEFFNSKHFPYTTLFRSYTTSISISHFTQCQPLLEGTTARTGNPCE